MNVPLFKTHAPSSAVSAAIAAVCDSGYLNEGAQVAELEAALSRRLGAPSDQAVLLNSCTSALELSMNLMDVDSSDAVITTSMTCLATNAPIVHAGAEILWADINASTGCIDPDSVLQLLQERNDRNERCLRRVKAVICVNWAGNVCDLLRLNEICSAYGAKLVQDAAHAFGARFMGRPIAEQADFTCFSFQAIKHFTTGDGGLLVCRDPAHHQRARRLRWFGLDRDAVKDARGEWKGQQWNVDVSEVGRKLNMNNVAAAIGLANLPAINWILLRHRENARSYDRAFDGTQVAPLVRHGGSAQVSSAWVYTIRVDAGKRDTLLERLNAAGIRAGLVHVPNHRYECFSRFHRELPGTDEFSRTQLSLPCGWWVEPDQIEMIARTTLQVLNEI